ncbi:MAG: hypothetical protein COC01_02735 [Bacteroidetes bacterium]|nr:MAG: hypothetical protein COC01_02735 [Bacteroidota bacterium]
MSVIIRYRKVKRRNGRAHGENYRVYLDIYRRGMGREYEYPENLYVSKDYTKCDNILAVDRDSMDFALRLKTTFNLEILNNRYGFISNSKRKTKFYSYAKQVSEEKGKVVCYKSPLNKFKEFAGEDITFDDIDRDVIKKFMIFMRTNIAEGSAYTYLNLLKTIFSVAQDDGIIDRNPIKDARDEDKPKQQDSECIYLTQDEIKMLIKTEIDASEHVKWAFLFTCFSCLRIGDVLELNHSAISPEGILTFRPNKTKRTVIYQPLSKSALACIRKIEKIHDNGLVFWDLPKTEGPCNNKLDDWVVKAKIAKKIRWHKGRHTFACHWLSQGHSIYTLKDYMGHSSIKTTERYAHVIPIDKKKVVEELYDFEI